MQYSNSYPLPPGSRPYLFDYISLRPGDIVLTRDSSLRSRLIQRVTRGKFSHALICTTPPTLIEARLQGVRNVSARNVYISDIANVRVLRLKRDFENEASIAKDAAAYAVSFFSAAYDLSQALASVTNHVLDEKSPGVFCSELVAKAYKHAGLEITDGVAPDNVTPNVIASSPKLMEITDLVCRQCPDDFSPGPLEPIDGEVGDNPARATSLLLRQIFDETRPAWEPYYGEIRPRNIWDVAALIGSGAVKDIRDLDRVREIDAVVAEAINKSALWASVEEMAKMDGAAVGQQISNWREQLSGARGDIRAIDEIIAEIASDIELVKGQIESRELEIIAFEELSEKGGMRSPRELARFQRYVVHLYKVRSLVEKRIYEEAVAQKDSDVHKNSHSDTGY